MCEETPPAQSGPRANTPELTRSTGTKWPLVPQGQPSPLLCTMVPEDQRANGQEKGFDAAPVQIPTLFTEIGKTQQSKMHMGP